MSNTEGELKLLEFAFEKHNLEMDAETRQYLWDLGVKIDDARCVYEEQLKKQKYEI